MSNPKEWIRTQALELGFDACGFTDGILSPFQKEQVSSWVDGGFPAGMDYLRRNRDIRLNPASIMEGTKCVICVAMRYEAVECKIGDNFKMARYAYGLDYHKVMKERLYALLSCIRQQFPYVMGRAFVDTAPIPEKILAANAGIGWIGRNSLLIIPGLGSYCFLGELFLSERFEPDSPMASKCGTCTRCMNHCPGRAIVSPGTVDCRRCLSYYTIEHRGDFPDNLDLQGRIYGCDSCQEVCPWNMKISAHGHDEFRPGPELVMMNDRKWAELTEADYQRLFSDSAVERAGFSGLRRNIGQILTPEKGDI